VGFKSSREIRGQANVAFSWEWNAFYEIDVVQLALSVNVLGLPNQDGLPDEASALSKVRLRQDYGGQTSPLSIALFSRTELAFQFRLACQT
jgi:hypothetical protein